MINYANDALKKRSKQHTITIQVW